MDLHSLDLWELALPAIERAAVVIQSAPDVLTALASSPATPAPTMVRCTPDLWELALPAIERAAVV
ncbi:hypothetical protein, partial [Pseudomonas sp. SBB6]|uniref:hypothetical protein n=1 Tax=Pseudomonas sp. SBB6 TaxID=2962032 RepID=UPI0020B8C0A8